LNARTIFVFWLILLMILQFSYPDGLIKWCGASRSLLAGALKALSLQREHQLPTDRSLLVLAWVFSGGLLRKFPNQPHVRADIGIVIQPPGPQPTPIIFHEHHSDCDDSDV
jgi:hypothetical protein